MKKSLVFTAVVLTTTFIFHGILALLTRNDFILFESTYGQTLLILGGSMPTVFAFVFLIKEPKKIRVRFYASLFDYYHPKKYWIYTLGLPVLIVSLIGGVFAYVDSLTTITLQQPYLYPLYLFSAILFGGLEEVGWRGYLQRHLMPTVKLPVIALIIGVVWGLWHTMLFFVEGAAHQEYAFLPFFLGAIMFSAYITILYAKTHSVFFAVLFHASINALAMTGLSIYFIHHWVIYLTLFILALPAFIWLLYLDYESHIDDVTKFKKDSAYDAIIIDKKEK